MNDKNIGREAKDRIVKHANDIIRRTNQFQKCLDSSDVVLRKEHLTEIICMDLEDILAIAQAEGELENVKRKIDSWIERLCEAVS